jgi:SAM-dependent methyltransferase
VVAPAPAPAPAPADWSVWRDADVAAKFRARRAAIPGAADQADVLSRLLGVVGDVRRVVDLGCGDGYLLALALESHPSAHGVGVDGSADMLAAARERFGRLPSPTPAPQLIQADLGDPDWAAHLPAVKYDAVTSGFAIHHLEDAAKRRLYGQIFGLLRPGGVLINIEHVASASPLGEALFDQTYGEHQARARRAAGEEVTVEQVAAELAARPDKAANKLAPVHTQLQWLRDIGFADVDCYWKWFELAILAGYRPR